MDPAGSHDQNNPGGNPSPGGYNPATADFTFLAPSGAFNPYSVGLEFPGPHVSYDHLGGHASADDPPAFQPVTWPSMHTPMQHPASFPPSLSISPHALTPPGSGSASGHSSRGEASASPGASPASASTPPAIGNLSLSHHGHSHSHSHHRPAVHRSSSHQSGNDSSASQGSTGSMRYVVTGNESSGNESRGHKRRATKHADEDDSDEDEDDDLPPRRTTGQSKRDAEADYNRRREEIRKQRIESEQRRRDELREGYRRLKDVLPVSSQKSSKVSLLDRATQHIRQIEQQNENLQLKLTQAETELARLRQINETLMMRQVERPLGPPGYGA